MTATNSLRINVRGQMRRQAYGLGSNRLVQTMLILTAGCTSARPTAALVGAYLQQKLAAESQGALTLADYKKSNGYSQDVGGMKLYVLEWQARLLVQQDAWKAGNGLIGYWNDFSVMTTKPGYWESFGAASVPTLLKSGTTIRLTGRSTALKTEQGWRIQEFKVETSQLMLSIGKWIIPADAAASLGLAFDKGPAIMCSITGSAGPRQVEPFASNETSVDPSAGTCTKLDRARYLGRCGADSGGRLEGVCVILADGSTKVEREAYLAYFSSGRILYPALTSFLNEDVLNFGVKFFGVESSGSMGCVWFGRFNISDTEKNCIALKRMFGTDIFSEAAAHALRDGSFDASHSSAIFTEFMSSLEVR
jgi:hypothetical protein